MEWWLEGNSPLNPSFEPFLSFSQMDRFRNYRSTGVFFSNTL
jgi:hypothetical protein